MFPVKRQEPVPLQMLLFHVQLKHDMLCSVLRTTNDCCKWQEQKQLIFQCHWCQILSAAVGHFMHVFLRGGGGEGDKKCLWNMSLLFYWRVLVFNVVIDQDNMYTYTETSDDWILEIFLTCSSMLVSYQTKRSMMGRKCNTHEKHDETTNCSR